MKFLFDLFPVILFFGMLQWSERHLESAQALAAQLLSGMVAGGTVTPSLAPVLLSTAVAFLATVLQIGYLLVRRKKIDNLLWVSFAVITIFGGATIYFQNPTFIKWKPTILYWFSASALFVSQTFFKKNLIRIPMQEQFSLPDFIWLRLNYAWIVFFLALGAVNLYVAFNFSISTWATFKVFGIMGLMLVFIISQTLFLSKHIKEPQ